MNNRDFSKQIYSENALLLMDIVPIERLLHSVDFVLRTSTRIPGKGYDIQDFNAVILMREAITRVIHDLAAKSMPAPEKESLTH